MTLVRYEPWTIVSQLQDGINRAFNNVADTTSANSSSATADWAPPVDIAEYADQFELFIDLPGVDPKSVERVTAKGRDGVLEVTIGKQAKAQPRRIKIAA
jgi:HSP20 family protein